MAYVRSRKLKGGKLWWYVTDNARREYACGAGEEGFELAKAWAGKLNALAYQSRAGFERGVCLWDLQSLHDADLEDAVRRGLRTVLPQGGKKSESRRESHWRMLLAYFGARRRLDLITPADLRAYADSRSRAGTGPATINRDLTVLRRALRMAKRLRSVSGYTGDPFAEWEPLEEAKRRRKPIALTRKQTEKLIRLAWRSSPAFGAAVEFLALTASRLSERPERVGRSLRFPSHKGGEPRSFPIAGRLAELLRLPRKFSRRRWKRIAKRLGMPTLRPHDLRHSAASQEFEAGAGLEEVQQLLGHKTPDMAGRVYLHLFPKAIIRRVKLGQPGRRRNERTSRR